MSYGTYDPAPKTQRDYTEEEKLTVWNKGQVVPGYDPARFRKDVAWPDVVAAEQSGYDPARFRKDVAGAWMEWSKFGDASNELGLGWEIDHLKPVAKDGTDNLYNLRPLQWKNNRSKGDDYPVWISEVSSSDNTNIYLRQRWTIN